MVLSLYDYAWITWDGDICTVTQQKYLVFFCFLKGRFLPPDFRKYSQKSKAILAKSFFWRTPKCHAFRIFLEMWRWDLGFTGSDNVTAYMRDTASH